MFGSAERPGSDRRVRKVNLLLRTAIVEALPTLEANAQHLLEVDLRPTLQTEDDVRAYVPFASEVVVAGDYFGVKTLRLGFCMEPPTAVVDIEMGAKPIGYLRNGSVHLFDD